MGSTDIEKAFHLSPLTNSLILIAIHERTRRSTHTTLPTFMIIDACGWRALRSTVNKQIWFTGTGSEWGQSMEHLSGWQPQSSQLGLRALLVERAQTTEFVLSQHHTRRLVKASPRIRVNERTWESKTDIDGPSTIQ